MRPPLVHPQTRSTPSVLSNTNPKLVRGHCGTRCPAANDATSCAAFVSVPGVSKNPKAPSPDEAKPSNDTFARVKRENRQPERRVELSEHMASQADNSGVKVNQTTHIQSAGQSKPRRAFLHLEHHVAAGRADPLRRDESRCWEPRHRALRRSRSGTMLRGSCRQGLPTRRSSVDNP